LSAALLEQSATAAPPAVAASLTQAFAQLAPPAASGLLGLAARWMSLTKVQCAGLCCAVAIVPVLWEANVWHTAKARAQTLALESELLRIKNSELQAGIEALHSAISISRTTLANTEEEASKAQLAKQQYADWKKRVHNKLFSPNYQWPEDCPFIRIPKSLASTIQLFPGVSPEGVLRPEMRELLGLTPEERVQVESSIQQHLARLTEAMEANIYPTNDTPIAFSGKILASASWMIPTLSAAVQASSEQVQQDLATVLGLERWQIVKRDIHRYSSAGLGPVFKQDLAGQPRQGIAWIYVENGELDVGISSLVDQGTSFAYSPLREFLPEDHPAREQKHSAAACVKWMGLDEPLTQRLEKWLKEQALARLGDQNGL
jgi:hypothetical protein